MAQARMHVQCVLRILRPIAARAQVWQGCLIAPSEAEPPVRTDPWEVLQPLRDNRPVHGGTACAEEVVMLVRGLNFQLDE